MEAKKYLKIIRENVIFLVILVVVGAALGFYSTKLLPAGYLFSQVYFVSSSQPTTSDNIREDKAITFTDSAVSILESRDFQQAAEITESSVDVKKLAHQVISITVTSNKPAKSQSDLFTLVTNFNVSVADWLGSNSVQLKPVGVPNNPSFFALDKKVMTGFGALIGLIASVSVLAVVRYFKL